MAHYRKKPIVIKAVQWDGTYLHAKQLEAELELTSLGMTAHPPSNRVSWWKIATLEDGHVVSPMDWIITGVKGEHYPCKPDIFELTYEAAIAQPEQTATCFMCRGKEWNYMAHAYPPGMAAPETKVNCTQWVAQPEQATQPIKPSLLFIDELAVQYCTSYASPQHVTFSVQGLQRLIQAIAQRK